MKDRFPESALYLGRVLHLRHRPVRHRLDYRVFFLLLDLGGIDSLARGLRLLAYNWFGVLGFHDADHGARDGSTTREWVEAQLRAAGLFDPEGRTYIACFPRMWGYVFNPLSIYYCYDREARLIAVLHEVRNTFGEMHGYLLPVDGSVARSGTIRQTVTKDFHVSPFIPMEARYEFRLSHPGERIVVGIEDHFEGGLGLSAVLAGRRRQLTDGALALAVAAHPLMTLKVIAAIHWHALRLWLKGVPVFRKPKKPAVAVTVGELEARR